MRTAAIAIKNSPQNILHFEEREVLKLTEQKHGLKLIFNQQGWAPVPEQYFFWIPILHYLLSRTIKLKNNN